MSKMGPLLQCWPDGVKWFVIGGLADGDEAQTVRRKKGDHIKCFGVEANPAYFEKQQKSFPGTVVNAALWDKDNEELELSFLSGRPQSGSVCAPEQRPDFAGCNWEDYHKSLLRAKVRSATLDRLSDIHGPFDDVCLWLDIEFAELNALKGASRLLDRCLIVNLEAFAHLSLSPIVVLLRNRGLHLADVWNCGPTPGKDAQDYIFVRK